MKNKWIKILIVLALFLPTVVAVINFATAQNAPISHKNVSKVVLTAPDGREYAFTRDSEEGLAWIRFFVEMNDKAESVPALPQQLTEASAFEAVITSFDTQKEYTYYFTLNPKEAFVVNAEGKAAHIEEEAANAFLLSSRAESLYPDSVRPTLTLADGRTLLPDSMVWKFRNISGAFTSVESEIGSGAEGQTPIEISGGINPTFSLTPDYLSVKVVSTSDGQVLYDGLYEDLGKSLENVTADVSVSMLAKWYESDGKGYSGESAYSFPASLAPAAVFYLGESAVEQGDFVVITGKNVRDEKSIAFSSSPAIGFTPVFFRDGDLVRALVPLSLETVAGDYTFTITSGSAKQEMLLKVTPKEKKATLSYKIAADIVNKTRTAATQSAFATAMAPVAAHQETTRYFDGLFLEAVHNKSVLIGFGRIRKIDSTGETYTHQGVDYIVNKGDNVQAVNGGKVIYVGEQTLSGKLVVIDHGFGLKSWFAHMESISVKEGDVVKTGDVIGKVGSGGFTNSYNCHYTLTVFDIPVCPYPLWEDGVVMFDPQ